EGSHIEGGDKVAGAVTHGSGGIEGGDPVPPSAGRGEEIKFRSVLTVIRAPIHVGGRADRDGVRVPGGVGHGGDNGGEATEEKVGFGPDRVSHRVVRAEFKSVKTALRRQID